MRQIKIVMAAVGAAIDAFKAVLVAVQSPSQRVRIRGHVRFRCEEVEAGYWIAECDKLDVTIAASSFADLQKDLVSVLDTYFEDLRRTGDLERVLASAGLEPVDASSTSLLDVPFSTDVRHGKDSAPALAF